MYEKKHKKVARIYQQKNAIILLERKLFSNFVKIKQ